MNFTQKFLLANSGTMVLPRFHLWASISLLAAALGRRVYVDHKHFQVRPMLFTCLVAKPGVRKSLPKNQAAKMYKEVFPVQPIGSSIMTREQIITRMASEENLRCYTNEYGETVEYRPMTFFINELKNFISVNPAGMVDFLTDIYDTDMFESDNLKHSRQVIPNPCMNILACETPRWIIENLRMNVIAGGFSRRMLMIYEVVSPKRITFPQKTKEAYEAEEWCKEHLRKISTLAGPIVWTDEAREFLDDWFVNMPKAQDEVMEALHEAKDILVTKVAMALAVGEPEPQLLFTKEILRNAIAIIDQMEEHLPKLTAAVGRNELAIPQQRLLQMLEDNGGWMPEVPWHKAAGLDLDEREYQIVKKFLMETNQIHETWYERKGETIIIVALREKYIEMKIKGEVK